MKVTEIEQGGETPEPGIYVVKDSHTWGFKPMLSPGSGRECVPFEWGRVFPEIEAFMTRFPTYWKCDMQLEVWVGETYHPEAVFWARRDSKTWPP